MVQRAIHLGADGEAMAGLAARFVRARAELKVAEEFPAEVLAAAERAAAGPALPELDLTDLGFVTVDPPGSTDLDQAMFLRRDGDGYRVDYAIADVPAFVPVGGPVSDEAVRRGQTLYAPDHKVPLHPPVLSEGAASLLEGQLRPAFVWRFTLDAAGAVTGLDLVRAMVRSRHRLDYGQVQAAADTGAGEPDVVEQARLLREVGTRRIEQERARGGASLPMPEQEVSHDGSRFELQFRPAVPAEDWNAQLSLMTGMAAAELMLKAGVGVLRTMPPPDQGAIGRFRRQARALGVDWPKDQPYGEFVRGLDRTVPRQLALLHEAAGLFRGAAYTAFDGAAPEISEHAAVAAPYAHVTAPLRRLVDRFGLLVSHAAATGTEPDDAVRSALPALVERMAESDRTAKSLERRCIDLVEAAVLADRVGETFPAVTIDEARDRTQVQLLDPAVVAPCEGRLPLGDAITVRLEAADPDAATVRFAVAGEQGSAG
jgi:exoribonuclease R